MEYKEIVVPIQQRWQRECLESIFGDEPISELIYGYSGGDGTDEETYKLEVVLRRIIPGMKADRDEVKLFEYMSGQSITEYVKEGWPEAYQTWLKEQNK